MEQSEIIWWIRYLGNHLMPGKLACCWCLCETWFIFKTLNYFEKLAISGIWNQLQQHSSSPKEWNNLTLNKRWRRKDNAKRRRKKFISKGKEKFYFFKILLCFINLVKLSYKLVCFIMTFSSIPCFYLSPSSPPCSTAPPKGLSPPWNNTLELVPSHLLFYPIGFFHSFCLA